MDLPLRMIFDGIDRQLRRQHRNAVDDHRDSEFECDRLNSRELVHLRENVGAAERKAAAYLAEIERLQAAVDEKDMLIHYWMRQSNSYSRTAKRLAEGWAPAGVPDPDAGKRMVDQFFDEEIERFNGLPRKEIKNWKRETNAKLVERWRAENSKRRG